MNKFFTTLLTLAAIGIALPASSAAECTPSTSDPELDIQPYYVDLDFPAEGIWLYEESNGIPGLQRGDSIVDDTCGGQIESDTIVF